MIIVSGLHRKTGAVRTQDFKPGQEGPARKFRERLRSLGYNTVLVNEVKERYREAARRTKCEFPGCDMPSHQVEQSFPDENITGYQLHSLGTAAGYRKDNHITKCQCVTLEGAIEEAEDRVKMWSDGHKGIVIYRAYKLVRKITKPTTEIVELS